MLHVDPQTVVAAPPLFNPIAFVAHLRAAGIQPFVHRPVSDGKISFGLHTIDADADVLFKLPVMNEDERASVASVLLAEQYVAGARECGVVIFPWRMMGRVGACEFGQEDDGPNDHTACSDRFMKHPAFRTRDDFSGTLLGAVLCAEIGLEQDDPDLNAKVNAHHLGARQ